MIRKTWRIGIFRLTLYTTPNAVYDYTIVMGSEISTSSYGSSTKFVSSGETKQLSSIIQQNQQKFLKTETYDRINQGINIGLEVFPVIKYASYMSDAIKLSQTGTEVVKTAESITRFKTTMQTYEATKSGNVGNIFWQASGIIPGWGLCKEIIDAFNYKSPGLNPFEKVNSYGGY